MANPGVFVAGPKTHSFRSVLADQRGATYIEYLVLLGLVAFGAMGSYRLLGQTISGKVTQAGQSVLTFTATGRSGQWVGGPESLLPGLGAPLNDGQGTPDPGQGARGQDGSSNAPEAVRQGLVEPWPQQWLDNQRYNEILEDPTGSQKTVLDALPGGSKPTKEELAQIDAIIRKYEAELLQHQGEPGFDQRELARRMAQELAPLAAQHRNDFTWFYYVVKPESVLDLKNRDTGPNGETLWNNNWTFGPYQGKPDGPYTGDVAGNYLYGYVGSEVFGTGPLGQSVLKGGGGAAQVIDDGDMGKYLKSLARGGWGDNAGDADKAGLGISDYQRDHGDPGNATTIPRVAGPLLPYNPERGVIGPTNRDPQLIAAVAAKETRLVASKAADFVEDKVDDAQRAAKRIISDIPLPGVPKSPFGL